MTGPFCFLAFEAAVDDFEAAAAFPQLHAGCFPLETVAAVSERVTASRVLQDNLVRAHDSQV